MQNPYESPLVDSQAPPPVQIESRGWRKAKAIAALFAAIIPAVTAFAWPGDWAINVPLAVFFGPWLAICLGGPFFLFGGVTLLAAAAFVSPAVFKTNGITIGLLVIGIAIWCISGYLAVQILWA